LISREVNNVVVEGGKDYGMAETKKKPHVFVKENFYLKSIVRRIGEIKKGILPII